MADISATLDMIDSAIAGGGAAASSYGTTPGGVPIGDNGLPRVTIAPKSNADAAIDVLSAGIAGKLPEPAKPYRTTNTSRVLNTESGVNSAIAGTLGAPIDLATWALNKGIHGVNAAADAAGVNHRGLSDIVTGHEPKPLINDIENPVGGSESIKKAMGLIGANPDNVVPQNTEERIFHGVGEGIGSAVTLPLGVEALAAGKAISPAAATVARTAVGAPDALNATIGGAAGGGSAAAQEMVPEPYKPLAAVAGGLVGGAPVVIAHGAVHGARAAIDSLLDHVTEAGARRTVGREMTQAATDAASARENLASEPHEIVPGSVGTTAQIAGDTGLLGWERGVRQQNAPAFNDREAAQNTAQTAHLESVQPTGNAADLPGVIAGQREAAASGAAANTAGVEARTAADVARAEAAHKAALEGLGTLAADASPADISAHFREARAALEASHDAAVTAAERQAATARTAAAPAAQGPEEVGQNLRGPAEAARATAKEAVDKLYKALPDDIEAPSAEVAAKARTIKASLLPEHAPMEGEEARLFGLARNYGEQAPLANLNALRSSILSEKANVKRTNPQAYGRLSQLQGAVENAIDHGIESRAALDQVAVRRGTMTAEDALPARINQAFDETRQQPAAVEIRSERDGSDSGRRTGGDAGGIAGQGEANGRPGNATGREGLPPATGSVAAGADRAGATGGPGQTLTPVPAGTNPLREANAAYKDLKQTFDEGPVGDITARNGRGQYDLSPAELTRKVFHPGDTGAEDVRAYVKAVGPEQANTALSDAAAHSLQEKATRADGTFDPNKVDGWLGAHKTAIAELPPQTRAKFENAASAQRAVEDAFAARRDALSAHDRSEAGKIMGLRDASDIVREVGSIVSARDGARRMGELATAARDNPAARDGLQRAIVEHVMNKFLPDGLERAQSFVRDKADVLGKVFSPEEIKGISDKLETAHSAGANVESAKATRQTALTAAQAAEKDALDAYDKTVLGKIMNTEGTANVLDKLGTVFGSSDSVKQMGLLADAAARVKGGTEALRKAVTEMIKRDYSGTAEVGTSGEKGLSRAALDKFMKENTETLEKVLSPEQVGKLKAIVDDQLRANRSITATKLKGGSDTNQNQIASGKSGSILSMLAKQATEVGGTVIGSILGGPGGAVVGNIGAKASAALRDAGLNRLSEIRIRAALDPQFGKALLDEVPKYPDRNAAALIALRARQLSVAGAAAGARQSRDNRKTAGARQ